MNVAQRILALDASTIDMRESLIVKALFKRGDVPACSCEAMVSTHATLYLRRRNQLLSEQARLLRESVHRAQYLLVRKQILSERLGCGDLSTPPQVVSTTSDAASDCDTSSSDDASCEPVGPINADGRYWLRYGASVRSVPTWAANAKAAMDSAPLESFDFQGQTLLNISGNDLGNSGVNAVRFAHEDRSLFATATLDGVLAVCELLFDDNAGLFSVAGMRVVHRLTGHGRSISDIDWAISNDFLLSSSWDSTVRMWDVSAGHCVRVVTDSGCSIGNADGCVNNNGGGEVLACRFSLWNNNLVVTGNMRSQVQVFNLSTGKRVQGGVFHSRAPVRTVSFDASGELLFSGDDKGFINILRFNVTSGCIHPLSKIQTSRECVAITSIRHTIPSVGGIKGLEGFLLVNVRSNRVLLYDILSGLGKNKLDVTLQLRNVYPNKHRSHVIRSSFCPLRSFSQGVRFATGGEGGCVSFFDAIGSHIAEPLNLLQAHCGVVIDVTFNRDESVLLACDTMGKITAWVKKIPGN